MKQIVGTWQNLDGSPVAGGRVFFKLSNDAVANGTTQVSSQLISFTLDGTGSIPANTRIWANDELAPAGTVYTVAVVAAGLGLVWGAENLSLAGAAPININTAVPGAINVIAANPVLQNPFGGGLQTVTGPLNITGALGVTGALIGSSGIFTGAMTAGSVSVTKVRRD